MPHYFSSDKKFFRPAHLAETGMNDRSVEPTRFGIGGRGNWLLAGIGGGILGAILFGAILWAVDPQIMTETIPGLYGFESGNIGWALHIGHGIVLGIIFGFLITREIVLGALTADVETGFIATMGLATRMTLAGVVYGLLVWAALPLIAQSVLAAGGVVSPGFPFAAIESLLGHILYGVFLALFFSLFVDIERDAQRADDPFEESPQGTPDPDRM